MVWGTLGGLLTPLRSAAATVGGTFAGILVPLCLSLKAVEDRSDRLLTRGMTSGDVKELLGGSWALMS